MTIAQSRLGKPRPKITWEKLPTDFLLPDDPVDNELQPLLAAALRESLELAGLIIEANLIATNFGICANVDGKIVVKAPDWVYVANVRRSPNQETLRSYTPNAEGEPPLIVMEFISETEGGEYSINPHYPFGKWYFYEQILQVPIYAIFHPKTNQLEVYRLVDGQYQIQSLDQKGRIWLSEMNLFLGTWQGKRNNITTTWLRWWDQEGNLLLWGQESLALERQKTEQLELQQQKLIAKLKELGVNPDDI